MLQALPNQVIKFMFNIRNEMNDIDMILVGIHLAHPQNQFQMNDHPFVFGGDPHLLKKSKHPYLYDQLLKYVYRYWYNRFYSKFRVFRFDGCNRFNYLWGALAIFSAASSPT